MSKPALVCDTTLLLYLARIGQVQLIPALFEPAFAPRQVVWELDSGRSIRPDTIDPHSLDWLTVVEVAQTELGQLPPNRLGIGERAVVAFDRITNARSSNDIILFENCRVLRKYLNYKPGLCEQFGQSWFRNLCKKQ